MADFKSLDYAQSMRDVIREFVYREIDRMRPTASFATVDSIDELAGTCDVIFPGDTQAVPVAMYTIRPKTGGGLGVGNVVRIEGQPPRRHVSDVVNGFPKLTIGALVISGIGTVATSANMCIDITTGVVSRISSSIRYKKNVQTLVVSEHAVMQLRAVKFQPMESFDQQTYLGLIAEEIAEIRDPALNDLIVYNTEGEPEAVNYDRLAVVLLPVIQNLVERVRTLESQ